MEKHFAIIDRDVFLKEDKYSDFLEQFEGKFGKIDVIIQRNPIFHKDKMILEINMKTED